MVKHNYKVDGERIRFVPFDESHLNSSKYLDWLKEEEVMINVRPDYKLHSEFQHVKEYIEALWSSESDIFFAIEFVDTGDFIGTFKIGHVNWKTKIADLGIMIGDKAYWGKGLATDAFRLGAEFCFNQLDMRKVVCGCTDRNVGMKKVAPKVGFREEGCFRRVDIINDEYYDHLYYGMFKDELIK